jgi:hypothetical protein
MIPQVNTHNGCSRECAASLAKVGVAGSNPVVCSNDDAPRRCVKLHDIVPHDKRVQPGAVIRRTLAIIVALALVAACSASKSTPAAGPSSTVPVAAVRGYTASICGSVRSLRTISRAIEKFMPTLLADSASRTRLKVRFEAWLRAAASAATLGADFLTRARVPENAGIADHEGQVRDALALSAADYDRWREAVAAFDTYDRDNWEDELLTFEHNDMLDYGKLAWERVVTAAMGGPVGRAVGQAARSDPACRGVFGA